MCFLVAVPGACVSFFIRLRTFRIDVFGFSSSRSDLFYFFVVSVCTFRIAAFFVFSGSLDVRFELRFFVCFRSGARDFCVPSVPHRFVCFSFVFVVCCRSAGHVSHSPFLGGLCLGDGVVLLSPPGPTRRFLSRHGAYVSHRCVFFPIVFFIRPGAFAGGRKFVAVDLCMPPLRVNPSPPRSTLPFWLGGPAHRGGRAIGMAAPGAGVDFAAVAAALEDPLGSTQDALAACDRILLLGGGGISSYRELQRRACSKPSRAAVAPRATNCC